MKLKIYLLITDWAREFSNDVEIQVFTSLNAAQLKMQQEYTGMSEDYVGDVEYVREIDDMSARIYCDKRYDIKHDSWSIEEKEVDLDLYIVPKDFDNFYIEKTQCWAGTHTAAVYTKEEADAIVEAERKLYNLNGTAGPYVVKLINDQPQLVEDYGKDL